MVELSWEPRATVFKNFLTPEECDTLIALACPFPQLQLYFMFIIFVLWFGMHATFQSTVITSKHPFVSESMFLLASAHVHITQTLPSLLFVNKYAFYFWRLFHHSDCQVVSLI